MITVRPARVRDVSAIIALLLRMHREATAPISPPDEARIAHQVVDTVSRGVALVGVVDRQLIGSIGGVVHADWWSSAPRMFELWWYVLPDRRRGTGLGMELFRKFKAAAGDMPVRMETSVGGDNKRMDRLCARVGLQKAGHVYTE